MVNIILADFFCLRRTKIIHVLFGIVSICALVMVIVSALFARKRLDPGIIFGISGVADAMVMYLIASIVAGIYISGDFDNNAVQDAISCGLGRGKIIVSKALVFFGIILIMLLPYIIVTVISMSIKVKFAEPFAASVFLEILFEQSGGTMSAQLLWKALNVMLVMAIVYMGQLSICVLLAFIMRKTVYVMSLGFSILIFLQILMGISQNNKGMSTIFSFTPYYSGFTMLSLNSTTNDLIKSVLVSLAYITIVLLITFLAFRKKEVK